MQVSELVRVTSVPLATVKYYLREGLLPAGVKVSARSSAYDGRHVRRLTLLRVLREVGAIPVSRLRELVEAAEDTRLSVHGMFAPSPTAFTPFITRVRASLPVSSFWVAEGIATSQGTSQIDP